MNKTVYNVTTRLMCPPCLCVSAPPFILFVFRTSHGPLMDLQYLDTQTQPNLMKQSKWSTHTYPDRTHNPNQDTWIIPHEVNQKKWNHCTFTRRLPSLPFYVCWRDWLQTPSFLSLPCVQPDSLKRALSGLNSPSSSAMAGRLPDGLRSSQVSSSWPSISYLDPRLSFICIQPSQGLNWVEMGTQSRKGTRGKRKKMKRWMNQTNGELLSCRSYEKQTCTIIGWPLIS